MKTFTLCFFLALYVSYADSYETNGVCQYGGNVACLAECKVKGYNCGFCEGTEPNEVCMCEQCPKREPDDLSCTTGGKAGCIASCKVQGCRTGHCEGTAPDETCVCSGCGVESIMPKSVKINSKYPVEKNATINLQKIPTFPVKMGKFNITKKTNNSFCIKNTDDSSSCKTLDGCNTCGGNCGSVGYQFFCCDGNHCCCYQEPVNCPGCNYNNDCACVYNKC